MLGSMIVLMLVVWFFRRLLWHPWFGGWYGRFYGPGHHGWYDRGPYGPMDMRHGPHGGPHNGMRR